MPDVEHSGVLNRAVGKGFFPHQLSWLIDNPLRRLIISPTQFADRLPLGDSSRVLEIGPGSGYFSVEIARRIPDGRLELLDLQPQMLTKARRKLEARGFANVGYTASDAGAKIPHPDSSFDIAIMVAVLGEIPDRQGCLAEVRRVLRPGGVLAVHEHLPDPDRITLPELRTQLEAAGYRFQKHIGPRLNFTALFARP
jgi:ubiquinone/menaquinone biosynthesis C-methylase UbiE